VRESRDGGMKEMLPALGLLLLLLLLLLRRALMTLSKVGQRPCLGRRVLAPEGLRSREVVDVVVGNASPLMDGLARRRRASRVA